MTRGQLAALAGLSVSKLEFFEAGKTHHKYTHYEWADRIAAIRLALYQAGAIFTDDEAGVKLRSPNLAQSGLAPTRAQVREARQLLGISQARLATMSGIPHWQVNEYERGGPGYKHSFSRWEDRLAAIRAALEAAGVEFTNEDPPGVKLRKGEF